MKTRAKGWCLRALLCTIMCGNKRRRHWGGEEEETQGRHTHTHTHTHKSGLRGEGAHTGGTSMPMCSSFAFTGTPVIHEGIRLSTCTCYEGYERYEGSRAHLINMTGMRALRVMRVITITGNSCIYEVVTCNMHKYTSARPEYTHDT